MCLQGCERNSGWVSSGSACCLSAEVKSWVCFGNTFMKMDTAACVEMLETGTDNYNYRLLFVL